MIRTVAGTAVDVESQSKKHARRRPTPNLSQTATGFVSVFARKFRERLEELVASGLDPSHITEMAEQLADTMLKVLPQPSIAATVSGPVWTTEQVRVALARDGKPISRQAVDDRVRRGTLLALQVKEAGERAYPIWQFNHDQDGWTVKPGLAEVLQAIPESAMNRWTLSSWLQRRNRLLDNHSPLEALESGEMARVLALANSAAARWAH
jgi:hypothetical protein